MHTLPRIVRLVVFAYRWLCGQAFYFGHGLRMHWPIFWIYADGDRYAHTIVCEPCARAYVVTDGTIRGGAELQPILEVLRDTRSARRFRQNP